MKNTFKEAKRKLILSAIVLFFAFISTVVVTYAYWAISVQGVTDEIETGTVIIGSGDAVTTTATVDPVTSAGPLVPVGHSGTNKVDLTFSLLWESNNDAGADALTGVLAVTIDSIKINGVDYSHLFTVTIISGPGAITEDSAKSVVINVEFTNEPADAAEYLSVATNNLIVTVSFDVNPN